ncbi:MAG: four helix bundle protein [Candidatus Heritagella sp.]
MNEILLTKSRAWAVQTLQVCRRAPEYKTEPVLLQLIRGATGVGAILHEAAFGVPLREQMEKLSSAVRMTSGALYWLDLSFAADLIPPEEYESLKAGGEELRLLFGGEMRRMAQRLSETGAP